MSSDPSSEPSGESPALPLTSASSLSPGPALREVNYQHSAQFVPILKHLGCSLLVSTYAAGKVVSVGVDGEDLSLGFSNFHQAMGIAVGPSGLAVGGPNMIWLLRDAESFAAQIEPAGTYDRGYLARESFVTGNIHVHELAWGEDGELWVVNTLFSCLSTLHEDFSFVPRWRPRFITALAPQDRCHLNGLAMDHGKPKFVSALGTSDEPRGWRATKTVGGIVMEINSGETIADGFCMPHSPRLHQGKLFLLDSGRGRVVVVDPQDGKVQTVAQFPGYGRGLSIHGQFAFVGMSKARETSVFGGVPICEDRSKMRCGVVVVDLLAGRSVAYLEFQSGVEELFDVQVLPGVSRPVVCGPFPQHDQQTPVWVIPHPEQVDGLVNQSRPATVSRQRR